MTPQEQVTTLRKEIWACPVADKQAAIENLWTQLRGKGIDRAWFEIAAGLYDSDYLADTHHYATSLEQIFDCHHISFSNEPYAQQPVCQQLCSAMRRVWLQIKLHIRAKRKPDLIFM